MTYAADLGALEYEAETAWGENVHTYATQRLPIITMLDVSALQQQLIDPAFLKQRLQEGYQRIVGPQSGTIKTRFHLPGHGGPTSGAMTAAALETLLSYAFGKMLLGPAGSTFGVGSTISSLVTTASGTFTAGQLVRAGVGGLARDGRANGAWMPIASHIATAMVPLIGPDVAPNTGDVLHSSVNLYLPESANDAATAVSSIRLRALTAGLRYECHGCYAQSLELGGFNAGETLWVDITWRVSWWELSTAGTFPSSVAQVRNLPAPNGDGGFFIASVGTATRDATSKRNIRNFSITVELGVVELIGHTGISPLQTCIGARRTPSTITWQFQELADSAATLTPVIDTYWSGGAKHALWENSRTAGSSVAFYAPCMYPVGPRPLPVNDAGVWVLPIQLTANTGGTTTSELTMAAMVMGLA